MTTSGQALAQSVHPVHFVVSGQLAGWYPLLLNTWDMTIIFCGQASRQSSQPLHRSSLNMGLGTAVSSLHQVLISFIASPPDPQFFRTANQFFAKIWMSNIH